jgi:hypothetical protein
MWDNRQMPNRVTVMIEGCMRKFNVLPTTTSQTIARASERDHAAKAQAISLLGCMY